MGVCASSHIMNPHRVNFLEDTPKVHNFQSEHTIVIKIKKHIETYMTDVPRKPNSADDSEGNIENIIEILKYNNECAKLIIELRWFKEEIDGNFMSKLSQQLSDLTSLTHLTFIFSAWYYFSEDLMCEFGQNISTLNNLKHLHLSFFNIQNITDKALIEFSGHLSKLTNLISINLDFELCNKISDDGLTALSESISQLVNIASIELSFRACRKISDKGLMSLCENVNNLTNLTTIHFHDHMTKVTFKSQKMLTEIRRSLRVPRATRSLYSL